MSGLAEIVRLRTADCRQAGEFLPILAAVDAAPAAVDAVPADAVPADAVPADAVPADAVPADAVPEQVADHVAHCLRCQAEMAAYRRILRHLRALRHDEVRSPPGALAAVLAAIEVAALEDHAGGANRALRVAAVGGITVATAAATTAGVLVWMSRRRLGLADTG